MSIRRVLVSFAVCYVAVTGVEGVGLATVYEGTGPLINVDPESISFTVSS